jgi:hypothetical protein
MGKLIAVVGKGQEKCSEHIDEAIEVTYGGERAS